MRVFVAGGSGVAGQRLVPWLAEANSEPGWTLRYPSWGQGFEEWPA